MRLWILLVGGWWLLSGGLVSAQPTREEKVRADKAKVESEGYWIYGDFAQAVAKAKSTGKPILVVLRCIPCEECVKLDDDLVNNDPQVKPLLDKYVCVRLVSTNGLDLSLFQYDYDQSFAVFMLNADGTIYGRFGTRSHRTVWVEDVSVAGLAKALTAALELHSKYPGNKAELAAKRGPAPDFPNPERYPSLKDKYKSTLDYEGKVVQSCIHCHQVGDAQRAYARSQQQPVPDEVLFQYPHPKSLGLILNPDECATVAKIVPDTPAAVAGFQPGDVVRKLAGQPLVSIADVQWVLHHTPAGGATLTADVLRGNRPIAVQLKLDDGWRRRDDIAWRVTTWGLRRMAAGGMILEPVPAEEREKAGLAPGEGSLRVKNVGQFGPHAAAKNAGVKPGDIILTFDGRADLRRETDILVYAIQHHKAGDKVPLQLLRGKERVEVQLPMQE